MLPLAHRVKKYIHALLNLAAAAFAIAGLVAVIEFHNEQGYPNFYSPHSWLGLVTLSFLFLQVGLYYSFTLTGLPQIYNNP